MGEDCWLLSTHKPSVGSQPKPEELEPLPGREPGELNPRETEGKL